MSNIATSIGNRAAHLPALKPFEIDRLAIDQNTGQLQTHKDIEKYLKEEKKEYEKSLSEPKLLILGSSDSGKSTLLKQLKILHGG
jgi:polynucleotide 5'-kinase involved in rRNA processing